MQTLQAERVYKSAGSNQGRSRARQAEASHACGSQPENVQPRSRRKPTFEDPDDCSGQQLRRSTRVSVPRKRGAFFTGVDPCTMSSFVSQSWLTRMQSSRVRGERSSVKMRHSGL